MKYDKYNLNFCVTLLLLLQGKRRYYLDFKSYTQGNKENGVLYTLLVFITFWILYSYLVPISLFVTLEIVKFWQGFIFINSDREMRDPVSGEGARCRNSNLNEDLGKIDYIFSDKTGTLTSNEMRLRLIAIKGQPLGDLNKRLEDYGDLQGFPAIKFFSEQMHTAMQVRIHPFVSVTALEVADKMIAGCVHGSFEDPVMMLRRH